MKNGYITPEYFKEEPGISPLDISMKTGYVTPEYFKEEPGMSPPNISMKTESRKKNWVCPTLTINWETIR
jgi:hypothetical protein